jgi:hypothetical protein
MTGFIGTPLQLTTNYDSSHILWLSTTRSIPCWTTSVFSSHEWLGSDLQVWHLFTLQLNIQLPNCPQSFLTNEWISWIQTQSQSYMATDGRLISKSWCRAPLLFDSYGLVFVGRPLWREDGSLFCICCWPSSAQSFLDLATIFYCLSFETFPFVPSYDSQGHGGGIGPRFHTVFFSRMNSLLWLRENRIEATTLNTLCFGFLHPL